LVELHQLSIARWEELRTVAGFAQIRSELIAAPVHEKLGTMLIQATAG
jgi:hypothetical protein